MPVKAKKTKEKFDVTTFDVKLYDKILKRGLSDGVGDRWAEDRWGEEGEKDNNYGPGDGQMCIEAAICAVLGVPQEDDPPCVTASIKSFKINLNDNNWSSARARAKGLYDLGLAQLGSRGVITDVQFNKAFMTEAKKELIPTVLKYDADWNYTKVKEPYRIADRLPAGKARHPKVKDKFLLMAADVALTVLKKLKSPGVKLLTKKAKKK